MYICMRFSPQFLSLVSLNSCHPAPQDCLLLWKTCIIKIFKFNQCETINVKDPTVIIMLSPIKLIAKPCLTSVDAKIKPPIKLVEVLTFLVE